MYVFCSISPKIITLHQHPRSGKIKLVAPAVMYNGRRMPVRLPPPWLSQHTEEVNVDTASFFYLCLQKVLLELGYTPEEVEEFHAKGVV